MRFLSVLLAAASVAASSPVRAELGSPEELESFLDGIIGEQMKSGNVAAVTLSVVRGGELFFAKGYGFADREERIPVSPETTLFRPGSISKLFTWTAVMQLAEQGKLDLDADVNEYLTRFQIPDTFPQPITMKHLMTHTPGFEDGALGYLFEKSPSELIPLSESLAAHVPARVRPPGTYSSYSNYGTALAGLIVANVSGMPFEEYVEKKIFEPLGMMRSTFREPLPDRLLPDMAKSYSFEAGVLKEGFFEHIANFGPAGSLSSTATEMARFMIAHLQHGRFQDARILEEDTAREMHSRIYTLDGRLPGMAYGFYEERVLGERVIGHGGSTVFFQSNLALFPEHEVGLFVSYANGSFLLPLRLLELFAGRYLAEESSLPPPPVEPPADFSGRGARFAGTYRFLRQNWSTIEKATALAQAISVSVTEDDRLLVAGFFPEPSQWVEVQPLLFREVGGNRELAFEENEEGEITHLFFGLLPFMPAYRVPWYESPAFTSLLVGLALLLSVTMLESSLRRRREDRMEPGTARWGIRLAVLAALLNLVFVAAAAIILIQTGEEIFFGIPESLTAALVLPHVTSLLALVLVVVAVAAWIRRFFPLLRRVHFSLFALAACGLAWFYLHWNLLGFQY